MILYIIFGLVLGFCIMLPFVVKKRKQEHNYEKELQEYRNKLHLLKTDYVDTYDKYTNLLDDYHTINDNYIQKQNEINELSQQVASLSTQRKEIEDQIIKDQNTAKISAQNVYDTAYKHLQDLLEQQATSLSNQLESDRSFYQSEYEEMLSTFVNEFLKTTQELQKQIQEKQDELKEQKDKVDAAIAANKREEEKRIANNKYCIILTPEALNEIKRLRDIMPYFRNSRPISKIIWEGYFRQAANEMIARVVNNPIHSGIYRITNNLDGKTYIGQSVDIAERFRQHIKCGLGIDTPNNKLYKAMLQDGVENFSFEVLQYSNSADLNTNEVYWIKYYKAQEFGYNMNKGGA